VLPYSVLKIQFIALAKKVSQEIIFQSMLKQDTSLLTGLEKDDRDQFASLLDT